MGDDDGEGYTLTLEATSDYTVSLTDHTVTLNIEDDDVPDITDLVATLGNEQVTLTCTNPN